MLPSGHGLALPPCVGGGCLVFARKLIADAASTHAQRKPLKRLMPSAPSISMSSYFASATRRGQRLRGRHSTARRRQSCSIRPRAKRCRPSGATHAICCDARVCLLARRARECMRTSHERGSQHECVLFVPAPRLYSAVLMFCFRCQDRARAWPRCTRHSGVCVTLGVPATGRSGGSDRARLEVSVALKQELGHDDLTASLSDICLGSEDELESEMATACVESCRCERVYAQALPGIRAYIIRAGCAWLGPASPAGAQFECQGGPVATEPIVFSVLQGACDDYCSTMHRQLYNGTAVCAAASHQV